MKNIINTLKTMSLTALISTILNINALNTNFDTYIAQLIVCIFVHFIACLTNEYINNKYQPKH